ncbi:cellulase family glycosylhydrolase [Aureliella helgolandensis]|uniref:Cellulase (Glycosyl hydrolase family 5) n=1 Tax=Aureliella helgolandensis TaxID=2527968 RepID=A0A518G1H2_9BACT|nr:cellulase family glycosylhydrolase [Aureliella helgolandensis]QDV22448.1 Cellulase (glycosyl hydrolase family 5) [Aureliella helgolandensis]
MRTSALWASRWFVLAWSLAVLIPCPASELEWIVISEDGLGFEGLESGTSFSPWGFNYDHDRDGRLLEDYWQQDWPLVESAFREMKALGANTVRIHLQFGKFMEGPNTARTQALEQLERVVMLAEETELYIDLTGLGCYHKQDVPAWYDPLSEPQRWKAQAVFWEAVAKACASSSAIFCYDLMNEPVVAGGDKPREDWLGPAFGGKHFVQYVAIDRQARERSAVAKEWIDLLVAAIRKHDARHLITVGLVPWSLDRPGMTSGFAPAAVTQSLDFIAVHLYPEAGKLEEALETLQGFADVGKPVVIEELFPLKCSAAELGEFIDRSRGPATGWIGFYWGTSLEELRSAKTLPAAMTLAWLELFQAKRAAILGEE